MVGEKGIVPTASRDVFTIQWHPICGMHRGAIEVVVTKDAVNVAPGISDFSGCLLRWSAGGCGHGRMLPWFVGCFVFGSLLFLNPILQNISFHFMVDINKNINFISCFSF